MAFAANLTDTQQVTATVIGAVDRKGNPAPLDGVPAFSSDDTSIATFDTDTRDASGMTGLIVAGKPGTANLTITADAKIGPDVENITEQGIVTVVAGQAVAFSPVTLGAPEEQP